MIDETGKAQGWKNFATYLAYQYLSQRENRWDSLAEKCLKNYPEETWDSKDSGGGVCRFFEAEEVFETLLKQEFASEDWKAELLDFFADSVNYEELSKEYINCAFESRD